MEPQSRADLQREIADIAGRLEEIAQQLDRLADSIPEPDAAVLEGEAPWTLDAELQGNLYCIADNELRGASEDLAELARATPESVHQEWERRRARSSRPSSSSAEADLFPAAASEGELQE
jgi:predicted  nucleic acid-binding Zn-ribbon protein